MCTLALAWRCFEGTPVAVAANRDEATDRPAEPPFAWAGAGEADPSAPTIVAPRDAEAGGTWIGHNEAGLFVGIANRWTDADLAGERSRGLLVVDALRQERAESAAAAVEAAVARDEYDGFHLLLADADAAILLRWDGTLDRVDLEPGLHVVTNSGYDDRFETPAGRETAARAQAETASGVRDALEPRAAESTAGWLERARAVLADHDLGVCVHGDGYGTRSSSLIAIEDDGSATFHFADGPPCETDFEPIE